MKKNETKVKKKLLNKIIIISLLLFLAFTFWQKFFWTRAYPMSSNSLVIYLLHLFHDQQMELKTKEKNQLSFYTAHENHSQIGKKA